MKRCVMATAIMLSGAFGGVATAKEVAVCHGFGVYATEPLTKINCKIGDADNYKQTTLYALIKAGWSIHAVTPIKSGYDDITYIYLEK